MLCFSLLLASVGFGWRRFGIDFGKRIAPTAVRRKLQFITPDDALSASSAAGQLRDERDNLASELEQLKRELEGRRISATEPAPGLLKQALETLGDPPSHALTVEGLSRVHRGPCA